jgi:hypothetical protein
VASGDKGTSCDSLSNLATTIAAFSFLAFNSAFASVKGVDGVGQRDDVS